MMAQGTDGISRGDMLEGVMAGIPMLDFIPLNKEACERSFTLEGWIKSWFGKDSTILGPMDWFEQDQDLEGGKLNEYGLWFPRERSGK